MHKKSRVLASTGIIAVVALVLGLGSRVLSASGETAAVAPQAAPTTTAPPGAPDPNLYPFGVPAGGVGVQVPPPPGSPTLSPTIATKTTTRIFGADPFQEAVSVTQHIWPSALPKNAPNGTPDRPRAVTLLTTDDPLTAITATPIIHFPDDAPVLYVTNNGVPDITLNEIKRLGPSGINRYNNVDAFLDGVVSNTGRDKQVKTNGTE